MSKAQHTPGPWEAVYHEFDDGGKAAKTFVFSEIAETLVADCHCLNGQSVKESEANARLIAAAPELLDALETVLSMDVKGHELQDRLQFSDKGREILNQCRAAIAKARGE